jgi:hypothetical protein
VTVRLSTRPSYIDRRHPGVSEPPAGPIFMRMVFGRRYHSVWTLAAGFMIADHRNAAA